MTKPDKQYLPIHGEKIREARICAGLTVRQLAAGLGKGTKAVYLWENGESYPRLPDYFRLCRLLGCGRAPFGP